MSMDARKLCTYCIANDELYEFLMPMIRGPIGYEPTSVEMVTSYERCQYSTSTQDATTNSLTRVDGDRWFHLRRWLFYSFILKLSTRQARAIIEGWVAADGAMSTLRTALMRDDEPIVDSGLGNKRSLEVDEESLTNKVGRGNENNKVVNSDKTFAKYDIIHDGNTSTKVPYLGQKYVSGFTSSTPLMHDLTMLGTMANARTHVAVHHQKGEKMPSISSTATTVCWRVSFSFAENEKLAPLPKPVRCDLEASLHDGFLYCLTVPHGNFLARRKFQFGEDLHVLEGAGLSPFFTGNSAMSKQAIGVYATNFNLRMDTMGHILFYPQRPLVGTKAMQMLKFDKLPSGQNVLAAICAGQGTGRNQEDAVIMNSGSIDIGLFRSMLFRTHRAEEKRKALACAEQFGRLDRDTCIQMRHGNRNKVDQDGFVPPGTWVAKDDIIIEKHTPIPVDPSQISSGGTRITRKDDSTALRGCESNVVDKVMLTTNSDLSRFVKIRTRSLRIPKEGDKFSSLHGQKGVMGYAMPPEDMMFDENGLCPDVIINPHAVPSRMTLGQLLESDKGKVCAKRGRFGDATAFNGTKSEDVQLELEDAGFRFYGKSRMRCGITGEWLDVLIMIGPVHYQRLKHMVDDKVHARRRGPVQITTRQPQEGRSRDGGLR